jgi:putative toxin-antitoxin system antitoxin component (TIGR02293 family)
LPGKSQEPSRYVKHYTVERKRYGVMEHASDHKKMGASISIEDMLMDRNVISAIDRAASLGGALAASIEGRAKWELNAFFPENLTGLASAQALASAKSGLFNVSEDTLRKILGSAVHTGSERTAPCIARLDDLDLANAAIAGLPVSALSQVEEAGYTTQEAFELIFRGELTSSPDLSIDESDRAIRLIRIAVRAKEVFGNPEKAWRWLRKPKKAFNGKTCVEMLITEHGGREVENMLTRIEHGMAA